MAKRILYFVALLIGSCCAMAFTHEMGHIVGGWCCGGALKNADLLPWHLPYSIFDPDPKPLVTLWCGPVLGVVVPVAIALLVRGDVYSRPRYPKRYPTKQFNGHKRS